MRQVKIVILALLLLLIPLLPAHTANADDSLLKWTKVNIPAEGKPGNWVLASGSDIQHLTMARDGTLYAYGKGLTNTLYKSMDGGLGWDSVGKVQDSIVAIATAPDNAAGVYYATTSTIYKSTDAGEKFVSLLPNPGGAGSSNIEITSMAVARAEKGYLVAVATRDIDATQYGGVYLLDESEVLPRWQNTNLGNYDVYRVAFSPNFITDRQLVAVVTNEIETVVKVKAGGGGWGQSLGDARLNRDNSPVYSPVAVTNSAAIAFPTDYGRAAVTIFLVAIDTGSGQGDVYRVQPDTGSSAATDLNVGAAFNLNNVDITSIAISGNTEQPRLMAGAAASAQVYYSADGGKNWIRSAKPPSGSNKTFVVTAKDFTEMGKAYIATSGTESALSVTANYGSTCNQLSLIDTSLSATIDLAVSPGYHEDKTLFLLTFGGKHSLWRTQDAGSHWERVYSSALPYLDQIKLLGVSPNYKNSKTIFLTGTKGGNWVVAKSVNGGENFTPRAAFDPETTAAIPIDLLEVIDDSTLFLVSFDGTNGRVYRSTDGGFSYARGTVVGNQPLSSLSLSPNFTTDKTILAGNTNGWVYLSKDGGQSFNPLPSDATTPPLSGLVSVAFDSNYSNDKTVYVASDTTDKGLYRFIIGSSTKWESIDTTFPAGSKFAQPVVSADGILYAANMKANGGIERSLNPTYPLGPTFEPVPRGLKTGATLGGLWSYDTQLWSMDTTNNHLMTFIDSLSRPVSLTSPENKASGLGRSSNSAIKGVSLNWETSDGATDYKWQLSGNTSFSNLPAGFEGETQASSVSLPALEAATTYHWRVRATKPFLSPWSEKWSFTTTLGSESGAPKLISPEGGGRNVPTKPIFQWSVIDGAASYELLLSTDAAFDRPAIERTGNQALPTTAWQSDIDLKQGSTYYWKVRAVGSGSYSAWSAVSAFVTESAPKAPVPTPTPSPQSIPTPVVTVMPQPQPPTQQAVPGWAFYLFGGIGIAITILLIIVVVLLVLTIKQKS
ncbi:MAG: hypothetical protein HY667_04840 [Chloroflexi bacterium]|nr:hypothetical protein [Chloroflexota bacterium]